MVLPSVLGAGFGGLASWMVTRWSVRFASKQRLAEAKFDLARRLIADKSAGAGTIQALNEIPAFFGDDGEVMDAYAVSLPTATQPADMQKVLHLMVLVAHRSGLSTSLTVGDLAGGFGGASPAIPADSPQRDRSR